MSDPELICAGPSWLDDSGVTLGLYPWYILSENEKSTILAHGGIDYRVGDKNDAGYLTEFGINAGIELALYGDDYGMPFTISSGPEYVLSSGITNTPYFGLNLSGVVPIANGLGVLIEGDASLTDGVKSGLKIGVIVNNSIK